MSPVIDILREITAYFYFQNCPLQTTHLGASPQTISELSQGNHPFCDILFNAKRPIILCGSGLHARPDSSAFTREILRLSATIKQNMIENAKELSLDPMADFFMNGIFNNINLHASLQEWIKNLKCV